MRKLLASAATAALMLPAAASAEFEDSLSVILSGDVEDVCTIAFTQLASTTGVDEVEFTTSGDGNDTATGTFEFLIANTDDPATDTIGDIQRSVARIDAQFFCNGVYQATISSLQGALVNTDEVINPAQFANRLGYNVRTTMDGPGAPSEELLLRARSTSNALTQGTTVTGAQFNGNARFRIITRQNLVLGPSGRDETLNLISGVYEDSITISFAQDGTTPDGTLTAVPAIVSFSSGPQPD